MEIMTYVQARGELNSELSEDQIKLILTVSGRAKEWLDKIAALVKEDKSVSEMELVEVSGMGKAILKLTPHEEWVYLVNPSLAPEESMVVKEKIVMQGRLFSSALVKWLSAQEMGTIHRLSEGEFTPDETRVMRRIWEKQESIVDREELAQVLWGEDWGNKYSDWALDAMMSRLRKKMSGRWQIITIKGRGYMLALAEKPTTALKRVLGKTDLPLVIPGSIYPSDEYLTYMNDQRRVRKVYRDLFLAMQKEKITNQKFPARSAYSTAGAGGSNSPMRILCVNSYSYDNVDAIIVWVKENGWQGVQASFIHYDPRAIELHQTRIRELGVEDWITCWHDDLRESKLKDASYDLVINDFRLNFNQDDRQNKVMMGHTKRVLKDGGVALISTVVDGRYENTRYGADQEKAPINASKPGLFQADEHLIRRCWSVPYYRQLWNKSGFKEVVEFDIEEGKRWGGGEVVVTVDPWRGPYYRRWMMRK
jgi:hypothetical protein